MTYDEFLFFKLLDYYYPDKELEYDLMYEDYKEIYNQYEKSEFNNEKSAAYTCMINFLENKYVNL